LEPEILSYYKNFEGLKEGKSESAKKYMYDHILDIEKGMYTILKS